MKPALIRFSDPVPGSPLHTATGQAGDQVALRPDEDDQDRNSNQHRGGCQILPVSASLEDKALDADWQGQVGVALQEGEGHQKFVPGCHEVEKANDGYAWDGQGQNDAPEGLERAEAIDVSRL